MSRWDRLRGLVRSRLPLGGKTGLALAKRALAAGRPAEAHAALVAALGEPAVSADEVLAIGQLLSEVGDLPLAAQAFTRALELNPRSAEAPGLLGVTLGALGRGPEGIEQLREAVRRSPGHAVAHIALAKTLIDQGLAADGVAQLQRALELEPNDARALTLLGTALCALERWGEAAEALRHAVASSPGDEAAQLALGVALAHSNATDEALAVFERLLETSASPHVVRINLGLVERLRGQPAAAEAHLREAARLAPASAQARTNLGIQLLESGALAEAVTELTRGTELDPQAAPGFFNLGLALEQYGDRGRARAAFERAAALAPGDAAIAERLAAIDRLHASTTAPANVAVRPTGPPTPPVPVAAVKRGLPRVTSGALFVGTLETFSVAELLEFFKGGRRTGVLSVTSEQGQAEVHLRGGKVVGAIAPGIESLPANLRARGELGKDAEAALAEHLGAAGAQPNAMRLAQRFEAAGLVPISLLEELVIEQIKGSIAALLGWTQGNFAFDPNALPLRIGGIELDVGQLLISLVCAPDDPEQDWAEGGGL